MYVAKQDAAWTVEETHWLQEQIGKPEIRALVTKNGKKNDYLPAAKVICEEYMTKFAHPRAGESDLEFLERKKRNRHEVNVSRWLAETTEQRDARFGKLKKVRV